MKTIRAFFKALGDPHTLDVRTNVHLWFGFLWGLPVPMFVLALSDNAASPARDLFHSPGMKLVFLLHPAMFALVFGALGTLRRRLERENLRLIEELRAQAWIDPLTGLYNRRYVMEEFRNILRRADRSGEPVRAVLFDLDGFKAVNDRRGHLEGDQVLQRTAAALKDAIRQGDLLGRFGGDEFLMVAMGDSETVKGIVVRCQRAVSVATGLTISAGITAAATTGEEPESLIRRADEDLASSKTRRYEKEGAPRR